MQLTVEGHRRELRPIPGTLEPENEPGRASGHGEIGGIGGKNLPSASFERLSAETLLPTLRQMKLDLERQGHETRLRASGSKVFLELEVRASPVARGSLLVALEPGDPGNPGIARIEITSHRATERETVELDRLDLVLIVERVLRLLGRLLAPAPAPR